MHIYININIHIHTHKQTYTHTHSYTYTYINTHTHTHTFLVFDLGPKMSMAAPGHSQRQCDAMQDNTYISLLIKKYIYIYQFVSAFYTLIYFFAFKCAYITIQITWFKIILCNENPLFAFSYGKMLKLLPILL